MKKTVNAFVLAAVLGFAIVPAHAADSGLPTIDRAKVEAGVHKALLDIDEIGDVTNLIMADAKMVGDGVKRIDNAVTTAGGKKIHYTLALIDNDGVRFIRLVVEGTRAGEKRDTILVDGPLALGAK